MRVFKILTLVFLSLFYFANRAVSRAETNDIIHFDYNFTNILSESSNEFIAASDWNFIIESKHLTKKEKIIIENLQILPVILILV